MKAEWQFCHLLSEYVFKLQFPLLTVWTIILIVPTRGILVAIVVAVQSPSCVRLFVTPWTAARQASLSFTISRSLPRFVSIESVMPCKHLILCHPLLLLPK